MGTRPFVGGAALALRFLVGLTGLLVGLWGVAALWFDGPSSRPIAVLLGVLFLGGSVVLSWSRRAARRWMAVGLWVALVVWWRFIPPSNDRAWQPDVARPPMATFEGDVVTIQNVRDFRYRSPTEFDEHWTTRTIDLDEVVGLDLFLSYWGSPWIAHTILSWEFSEGPPLAISIETRKEQGEEYSAIAGFFRQYELYYVVADERDLVALRTNHRMEDTYLYRLETPPEAARALLVSYLRKIDHLAHEPEWYNAFAHNCTTTIRLHSLEIGSARPWDWRMLANGHIDEMLYERGQIATDRPFPEIRRASYVSDRGRAAGDAADYSARIRVGLPARPHALPTS